MKKIGILTFHSAHNYGAVLQTYGLRTHLRRLGYDVKILNYRNPDITGVYPPRLEKKYGWKDFRRIRRIPKMWKENRDMVAAQAHWKIQWDRFEAFINQVLLEGDMTPLSPEELPNQQLDAVIAGSDQIWNHWLTGGLDPVYFLDFDTKADKIFYGASNGKQFVPEEFSETFRKAVTGAHWVSTREKGLAEYITNTYGVKTEHVVDPTLLLTKEDYLPMLRSGGEEKSPYVFAYFIGEDDNMASIARYISRALGLPLVELHYYRLKHLTDPNQRADMGPEEFLQHMLSAEFVVTNSFHGTVFSLLFEKRFYSVYGKDARKDDLLKAVALEHRHIQQAADVDLNEAIDYLPVRQKLESLRKGSQEFLRRALDKQEDPNGTREK